MAYIQQNIYKVCYAENYRMREIKRGLNKWRNIPYSFIGRNNIFKVPVLPNLIHKFSIIPIKICSLVAQLVKNPPAVQETWIRSLGWEDSLEKGKAAHSSVLAWRIPGTIEPGGLPSMGSHSIRSTLAAAATARSN